MAINLFGKPIEAPTLESIRKLGISKNVLKNKKSQENHTTQNVKNETNLEKLFELFYDESLDVELRREIASSIGRQKDAECIFKFLKKEAFKKHFMDVIYQFFRTTLYLAGEDERFRILRDEMRDFYKNEVMERMFSFHSFRWAKKIKKTEQRGQIKSPSLLIGDNKKTLLKIEDEQVNFIFTSPPYYNARIYSDYTSYEKYLEQMSGTLAQCFRILEDGRFIIINVSPVITKRAGREFESIRYPIHFDFHKILCENGFYFIDEILWIKPEYSVPNRIAGYAQSKKPLSYKPNCISESLLVYRKDCPFLLDKNIKKYEKDFKNEGEFDSTNCWYISPKADKNHPAVFPEELCERVLKYYSFPGDVVCDPFAGSGTFGRVARRMGRIPLLCEANESYAAKLRAGGFSEI